MNKYNTFNHAKFSIRYHMIFSVKYHRKMLQPIIDDLKKSFSRAAFQQHWQILAVETDAIKDHHIHLLVSANPTVVPNSIVSRLKQFSTYDMWHSHYSYMRKFFWKGEHHLWTRGYFCSTIGNVSEKTLKAYIERQG